MSLEEVREQNKAKVVTIALDYFVREGIDKTKVSDIAKSANLTERSVFRYFETKADLVLAAALYFWQQTIESSKLVWNEIEQGKLNGANQVEAILKAYANQFFVNQQKLIFVQEAEIYLYRCGMLHLIKNKPIESFKSGKGPLSKALLNGIEDGSLQDNKEVEYFYFNAYDSLLGLMQKMATTVYGNCLSYDDQLARLNSYCEMLVKAIVK